MRLVKLIEEIYRSQWAIAPASLRAILSVVEGAELGEKDYKLFHALAEDQKQQIFSESTIGLRREGTYYTSIKGSTGFLMIDGPIIPRATWFSNVSGMVSLDQLTSEFKSLENNPTIKNIVLLTDTPGGVVTGVSDFGSLVRSSSKKTYAYTWMAASAGYWIASAVDTLVSPDTGMVGSIGTVLQLWDTSARDEKNGVQSIEIVSSQSPNKRPDPKTDEGRAVLQQMVDDLSAVFIDTVASNMGVTSEKVSTDFGKGAMFVAKRALSVGMINMISDFESFVKDITEGGLPNNNSARAENTAEVIVMDKTEKLTAKELAKRYPEAVAEIRSAAAADERDRLMAIEGLKAKYDNALPSVKTAVCKKIDDLKFDPDATEGSVAVAVIEEASNASVAAVDDVGKGRRKSAEVAGKAGKDASDNTVLAEASEGRVNGLVEARKRREGVK